MPESSASETGSAGYVRTPWDEDDSLVDFAKNAFEAASSEAGRNRSEVLPGEERSPDISTELEGALESQLKALDRNFLAPQRQHRSVFHELAVPPPRERSAFPALPPPSSHREAPIAADPWADEEDERWADEEAPADEDAYGWPDRELEPVPGYPDYRSAHAEAADDEDDRHGEAWADAWRSPAAAEAAPAGRARIALAPSMLMVAGLVAMAGGAGVAIGIQRVSTPELAPITEANAAPLTANATPLTANTAPQPVTETVNAPREATKLSYDRVETVGPPLRASVVEVERSEAPPARTGALGVDRGEAAALSDSQPLDAPAAEATTIASASMEAAEPADDVEDAGIVATTPPVPRTNPRQTAQTNAFVNMRTKAESGSPTVMVVPANVTVDLYRCDGWCEIAYNGKRGFVYKTFLGEKPKAKPSRATATASRAATQPAATAAAATANTAASAGTANAANTAATTTSPGRRWLDGLGFYR